MMYFIQLLKFKRFITNLFISFLKKLIKNWNEVI